MITRRAAITAASWLGTAIAAALLLNLADRLGWFTFETPLPAAVLGVITGMTYGLLAVGLVLIYRTNRIINFAHGQIGAFGAIIFGLLVVRYDLPYWLMLPAGLLAGAGVGAATETVVVRRLRRAPRLMTVVATLGVAQFLILAGTVVNPGAADVTAGFTFPAPPGLPTVRIGSLHIEGAYTGMLLLTPVAVVGVTLLLQCSRFGLALRAAAANPEAARTAGIFTARMSGLAWAIAGALSALSAILTQATQAFTRAEAFGPSLLLRALAAAVLARMSNLPAALAGGIGLGVVEQLLLWNAPSSGAVEIALFVIILVALLLQRTRNGHDEDKGSWAAVQALRPIPEAVRRIGLVRHLGRIATLAALIPLLVVPWLVDNTTADRVNGMIAFAIVGLSVGMLTGLAGQLSLGQFAVAGVGAVASYLVSSATGSFPLGIVAAALSAAAVCAALGVPALRMRGLMLTVTTLSFALATPPLLSLLLDQGVDPGRPVLPGGQALETGREYYWFALALFLIALWLSANVRRSGFGRVLTAVRDNEDGARAFAVSATTAKLRGYALAGGIAGLGGAAFGHALLVVDGSTFPAGTSFTLVVMAVVGGVAVLIGPVLGALLVIGVPAFVPLDAAGLAVTQLGLLLLILYVPGGLAQLIGSVRDRAVDLVIRLHGPVADPEPPSPSPEPPSARAREVAKPTADPLLEARDLGKRFGGLQAVNGVSLTVHRGETVGVIGPNGAGKTTTFELLSGFSRADSGSVCFAGTDVTSLGPERRARLGLIRSFQDAALFPTMTVTECVLVALERRHPTTFAASVTGWTRPERSRRAAARDVVGFMGLWLYRDTPVAELSTGTRRIAELACLIALEPTLLLLDEPSSGIAQRETEALGSLLADLKRQLSLTLVVIEHDMPLVTSLSDRLVAMVSGRVVRTGTPAEVTSDPVVVDAYLGRDSVAVNRSGAV